MNARVSAMARFLDRRLRGFVNASIVQNEVVDPDDVLAPPRYDLWGGVLRRQGVPLALLATHVAEPKRN